MMNLNNENVLELKQDFPLLQKKIKGRPITYLDNAATSQKPGTVINALQKYYKEENANIHRGVYQLSERATELYEGTHAQAAGFFHAEDNEIIFTRNTTESLNLLSCTLPPLLEGNEIVLTELEHHSNLVPWQQLAKRSGMTIRFIPIKKDFTLDYEEAQNLISENTAILSLAHVSNSLGTINDIAHLIRIGKENNAITVVDAAQSAGHSPINVKKIGCDFLACSSHKMLGPTGLGVLFGKRALLEAMEPYQFGGDMISRVTYKKAEWNRLPMKFEAGTPHVAGALGFAAALKYLKSIQLERIHAWEKKLTTYATQRAEEVDGLVLYGPAENRAGIFSFNIEGIHAHDIASLLDDDNICIRAGHHCTMPLMQKLDISGTARASFYLYNTFEDIDRLINSLKKVIKVFG